MCTVDWLIDYQRHYTENKNRYDTDLSYQILYHSQANCGILSFWFVSHLVCPLFWMNFCFLHLCVCVCCSHTLSFTIISVCVWESCCFQIWFFFLFVLYLVSHNDTIYLRFLDRYQQIAKVCIWVQMSPKIKQVIIRHDKFHSISIGSDLASLS